MILSKLFGGGVLSQPLGELDKLPEGVGLGLLLLLIKISSNPDLLRCGTSIALDKTDGKIECQ